MATITFIGKQPDMFQHADFTRRNFRGLIDMDKMLDPHGSTIYEMNSQCTYTFRYANLKNFDKLNGRYLTCQEYPSENFWVLSPKWMLNQQYLSKEKMNFYNKILDSLSLGSCSGAKLKRLVETGKIKIVWMQNKSI